MKWLVVGSAAMVAFLVVFGLWWGTHYVGRLQNRVTQLSETTKNQSDALKSISTSVDTIRELDSKVAEIADEAKQLLAAVTPSDRAAALKRIRTTTTTTQPKSGASSATTLPTATTTTTSPRASPSTTSTTAPRSCITVPAVRPKCP